MTEYDWSGTSDQVYGNDRLHTVQTRVTFTSADGCSNLLCQTGPYFGSKLRVGGGREGHTSLVYERHRCATVVAR